MSGRDPGDLRATRKAVALRYNAERDAAPRVTAKGRGLIAERILARAREHGVPVREDADLAALLDKLDLDAEIPEPLYRAVAETLAFVYRVNQQRGRQGESSRE